VACRVFLLVGKTPGTVVIIEAVNAAPTKDPALKKKIHEEQLALLETFQDEISSVIGVDMPDLP
jgi:hypothetical protein